MSLEWNESYSLGLNEIDSYHKRIIGLINALYRAVAEGRERSMLPIILDRLAFYAQHHFAVEEGWFLASEYPSGEKHICAHEEFRARLEELKKLLETETTEVEARQLLEFLNSWFIDHILSVDMKLVAYLKERPKK